ncbi:hypothetical protein B0H17DRAFT_1285106 [Mycena rosella]|uniref:Uncharacterized protein n=1 Tax=Mycena rosella TaxID=1033263 RepID=A0AAD7DHT4_MYCRO|nr:hypothetical protein B0H17DRAFT_1285106 [Mycena rosella]
MVLQTAPRMPAQRKFQFNQAASRDSTRWAAMGMFDSSRKYLPTDNVSRVQVQIGRNQRGVVLNRKATRTCRFEFGLLSAAATHAGPPPGYAARGKVFTLGGLRRARANFKSRMFRTLIGINHIILGFNKRRARLYTYVTVNTRTKSINPPSHSHSHSQRQQQSTNSNEAREARWTDTNTRIPDDVCVGESVPDASTRSVILPHLVVGVVTSILVPVRNNGLTRPIRLQLFSTLHNLPLTDCVP